MQIGGVLRGLRNRRTGFGQMLAAFALLAVAVRALAPAGYMFAPAKNDGRFITVVLCSGQTAAPIILDLETGRLATGANQPAHDDDISRDAPCVFATSAHFMQPIEASALQHPFVFADARAHIAPTTAPGRGLAAPPPWATGPPPTA